MMYNSKAFLLKRSKEIVKKKSWKAAKKDEKDTLLNTGDRPSICHFMSQTWFIFVLRLSFDLDVMKFIVGK